MFAHAVDRLRPYALPLVVLLITWGIIAGITPSFRGVGSIFAVLEGFPLVGLAALGLAVTIIAGELDLSVGSMAALAAVVAVLTSPTGLVPCILIATLVGVVFGAVQGTLIGYLRINSLVFTIGTLILLRGLTYIASDNAPIIIQNITITDPLLDRYVVFSISSITAVTVFILAGLFLTYTRWGREIYAIGGGAQRGHRRRRAAHTPAHRKLRHLGRMREPRRRTRSHPRRKCCATELRGPAAERGGRSAARRHQPLRRARHGDQRRPRRRRAHRGRHRLAARGSTAYLVQLVTGALLLTMIAIEFLAGRLTIRDTILGAGLRERTRAPEDVDSQREG